MKTAYEIYRKSLALLGEAESEENLIFRERAVEMINLMLAEVYETDLAIKGEEFPVDGTVPQIRSLDDKLMLSEVILFSLMPLGLAGYLLNEEESDRSSFFLQLYQKEREVLRNRCRRGRRHKIRRGV